MKAYLIGAVMAIVVIAWIEVVNKNVEDDVTALFVALAGIAAVLATGVLLTLEIEW